VDKRVFTPGRVKTPIVLAVSWISENTGDKAFDQEHTADNGWLSFKWQVTYALEGSNFCGWRRYFNGCVMG